MIILSYTGYHVRIIFYKFDKNRPQQIVVVVCVGESEGIKEKVIRNILYLTLVSQIDNIKSREKFLNVRTICGLKFRVEIFKR